MPEVNSYNQYLFSDSLYLLLKKDNMQRNNNSRCKFIQSNIANIWGNQ